MWEKLLKDAIGVAEESEVERFLLWLHSRQMGTTAAVGHANDQVKRALDVLDSHGFTISADMKVDMEAALALGEAGSEKEQCCNALAVHILYLGRAPGVAFRARTKSTRITPGGVGMIHNARACLDKARRAMEDEAAAARPEEDPSPLLCQVVEDEVPQERPPDVVAPKVADRPTSS